MEIIGQKVLHKTFGCGVIVSYAGKPQNNNKYIKVSFEGKELELVFPDAFKKHLEAENEKFAEYVSGELVKNDVRTVIDVKKLENDDFSRTTRKTPIKKTRKKKEKLRFGNKFCPNSLTIYMECCEDFGWKMSESNNFGRHGAKLYAKSATPEGYSPWFLSHHELTQTSGGIWHNVIQDDIIYEKWDRVNFDFYDDETKRVVFIRLGADYYFHGVFCVDGREVDEQYKCIKRYKRISKEYPV